VKFFLTAEEGVRARRRAEQVGEEVNIAERDERDKKREIAPAKAAEDAIIIDNSYQSVEETIKEMEGAYLRTNSTFNVFTIRTRSTGKRAISYRGSKKSSFEVWSLDTHT